MLSYSTTCLIGNLYNSSSQDSRTRRISLERLNKRRKSLPALPSYLVEMTKPDSKTKSLKSIKKRKGVQFPLGVLMQQAVTDGDVREIKQLISDFGSKAVEEREPSGLPPVMRAIFEGQTECLKLLVDAGADLTARDPENWSCLHVAAAMDDVEAAEFIVTSCEKGVVNLTQSRNIDGERPIDLAESVEMVRILIQGDLREFRLETESLGQESKSSVVMEDEMAVLGLVREHCHKDNDCTALNAVLKANTCYDTLLHLAATKNYVRLADYLCRYCLTPIETRNHKGWTPLHTACYFNNTDVAYLLVQYGANVNSLTHSYEKPSDLTEHELILDILEGDVYFVATL